MDKFYVYCVFSSESEEVLYVGKGSGDRIKTSLARLEKKYTGYSLEAKKLVVGLSEEEALQKETQLIAEIQPKENKIASWVREKEHDRFGKASVYFSAGEEVREFLAGVRKRVRVVAGGFEVVLNPLVCGKTFIIYCRSMEEGAPKSTFSISILGNKIHCTGMATGIEEPSRKSVGDKIPDLYSLLKNTAQSCLNLILILAELPRRVLNDSAVSWSKLTFVASSPFLEKASRIFNTLAATCGGRLFSSEDSGYIGVANDLGFLFDYYLDRGGRIETLVFKKRADAGRNVTFRMYMRLLESGSIRIEGQLYPSTFVRGCAQPFRRILVGDKPKKKESYYRSLEFFHAHCTGTKDTTLKQTLAEMSRQLGLPLICCMPTKKTLLDLVRSIAAEYEDSEVAEILEYWVAENLVIKPRSKTSAVYRFLEQVRIRTSLDMTTAKPSTATLIRNMVKLSTLSRSELLAFTEGDDSMRYVMRDRAKTLRAEFTRSCRFLVYSRS